MIPCKRPKVTVEWHPMVGQYDPANPDADRGRHVVICHVRGCNFERQYHTVKAGAQEEAGWHRQAHRAAVPRTSIVRDPEYGVHCEPCGGHRRTFGTRIDAEAWLDYHLSSEHGLVSP